MGRYPFFEAFSNPIRCISRNRNTRTSPLMSKKLNSGIHLFSGSPSSGLDDGPAELLYNIVHEAKLNPPMKWVKLGRETTFATRKADLTMDRADKECNSHALTANEVYGFSFCFFATIIHEGHTWLQFYDFQILFCSINCMLGGT